MKWIALTVIILAIVTALRWSHRRKHPPPLPDSPSVPSQSPEQSELQRTLKVRLFAARSASEALAYTAQAIGPVRQALEAHFGTGFWPESENAPTGVNESVGRNWARQLITLETTAEKIIDTAGGLHPDDLAQVCLGMRDGFQEARDQLPNLSIDLGDGEQIIAALAALQNELSAMQHSWGSQAWRAAINAGDAAVQGGESEQGVADALLTIIKANRPAFQTGDRAQMEQRAENGSLLWVIVLVELQSLFGRFDQQLCERYHTHEHARVRRAVREAIDYEMSYLEGWRFKSDAARAKELAELRKKIPNS